MTKDYYILRILKLLNLDPEDPENEEKKEELNNKTVLELITMIEEYKSLERNQSFAYRCGSAF